MMCNMDCFNCSMPDCVNDILSPEERKASRKRDLFATDTRLDNQQCKVRTQERKRTKKAKKVNSIKAKRAQRKWRKAHVLEERERNRNNHQINKDKPEYMERLRRNSREYEARLKERQAG